MGKIYFHNGGFIHSENIGDSVPEGAIEVSEEKYAELIGGQSSSKMIGVVDGVPSLVDRPTDFLAETARADRNRLLSDCDWTVLSDAPLTAAQKGEWVEYRQSLRNVPEQAGFPVAIEWPIQPSA